MAGFSSGAGFGFFHADPFIACRLWRSALNSDWQQGGIALKYYQASLRIGDSRSEKGLGGYIGVFFSGKTLQPPALNFAVRVHIKLIAQYIISPVRLLRL